MGSIKAIERDARGNPIVTDKFLEMERQVTRDAYFSSAFSPITGLTGDRRNMLEIRQRVLESFKKIGSPIGRIQSELFTPTIERVVGLLLVNRKLPEPPPELQGQDFKVEYIGALSLALQSSEVEAAQQWIGVIAEIEQIEPGAKDHVNFGETIRRMGRTFGVNEEDIASLEEVKAKREKREKVIAAQKQLEATAIAGQAYGQTTGAPEEGSPAGALMNG
jgi:hypothetical protein